MSDDQDPYGSYLQSRGFGTAVSRAGGPASAGDNPNPYDEWLRNQRRQRIGNVLRGSPAPEQAAEANKIGRALNVPAVTIDSRLGSMQVNTRIAAFADLADQFQRLGRWAEANPRSAAAAADDVGALVKISKAFDPDALARTWSISAVPRVDPTLLNSVKGVWASLTGGWDQMNAALDMMVDDWVPSPKWMLGGKASSERLKRDFAQAGDDIEKATPDFQSSTARGIYGGFASLAQMAPGLAASIATRSPIPAMMVAGGQVGSTAYGKYRVRGGTPAEAALGGGLEGAIEAGFEAIPMGAVVNKFGRTTAGRFLGEVLGKEMISEQATTLAQDAVDTAIANPNKTWGQYLDERPDAAYQTALAVLVMSGTLGAAHGIALKAEQRHQDLARAEAEGALLDTMADGAASAKQRTRDPSDFRAMMEHLTDGLQSNHVYVPAEKVRELMQSPGFEDSEFWQGLEPKIAEAEAMGGDVVVPIADAMTHIAGTPAWDVLRNDMRLTPGGVSRTEAKALADERGLLEGDLSQVADKQYSAARSRLFGTVFQKLVNAGTTPEAARQEADLVTHRYASRADRMGQALTGDEFSHVDIEQVLPEKLRAARQADATDLVINALRKGKASTTNSGPTLLEWIARRGGINDSGGDLKALGLGDWHKQKPFRRKILRDFNPADANGGISGAGDYGVDSTLRAAVEAGYFPELAGMPVQELDTNALLDAIGGEVSGNPRYASDPQVDAMRAAAEELGQMLNDAGLDPAKMTDPEIRGFIDRYSNADVSGRSYASGERGKIVLGSDGRATIQLFHTRNRSTFLHEAGHLWLEELRADASHADAPSQLRTDWETVKGWFASQGHSIPDDGSIPDAAHELFARGFERYLMEGRAPAAGLAKAFDAMRSWLVSIYRRVKNLKAPINDDVRAVMDRLLATDEEIAARHEAQRLEPMFQDAAAAGMTDAEFNAYMDLAAQAKSTANSELMRKALASLQASQTEQYRQWEAEARAEVSQSVDARPPFRALAAVTGGDRLNKQWVIDRFGADALSLLLAAVPSSYRDGGVHPDSLAEKVGLRDGHQLVETLIGMEKRRRELRAAGDKRSLRQATIDGEVQEVMAERYGDPFSTGDIEAEALGAVHNDLQGEVIAAEVRALARRTSQRPTPYSMAREWARRRVRSGRVRDLISRGAIQQYRRAAANNARAAFEALAQNQASTAFRHKQAQLVNNALVREARDAGREVDAAVARLARVASRKKIAGVAPDYLEQAHALLAQVDLRDRSARQVDRQQSFEAWANAREGEGHTIAVPKSFASTIGKTNWLNLSADELLGMDAAVKQIIDLGRLKQTLSDKGEARDHDTVVREAVESVERLPVRKPKGFEDPTVLDGIKSGVTGIVATLMKMETIFKRLDGSKHGAFNRIVFQPIAEAQAAEHQLMKQMLAELDDKLAKVPKAILATWNDQITIDTLYDPQTHEPFKGPRSRLIAMALNMGNESNAAKLAGGYGWREDAVMQALDERLRPEEWRYVQDVWDTVQSLWPRIVEVEKRVNGVAPEAIRPRVLSTSAGELRGGYFPVAYDPTRNRKAGEQAAKSENRLYENQFGRPATSHGFTNERTEVQRPILLSLDVMNRHVAEVVHDVTHREALMQAWRFLNDPRILDAVDSTMGRDISGLFRPWLQNIANEWNYDRAGMGRLEAFMKAARRNATFVGMAYRFTTIIGQLGGYVGTVERIGPKWWANGMSTWLRDPKGSTAFAMANSKELPSRFETLDRDVKENVRRLAGKHDLGALVQRFGYAGIAVFDHMVAVPTWLGAYNKALASGLEEQQAIHDADASVRESQGSGAAKDLAAIQRGKGPAGELGKALTMFYSFQSAYFQRLVELHWDIGDAWREKRPEMIPELAARGLMLTVVAPVLTAILSGQGPDDDNEESWTEWASKLSIYSLASPIPGLRDVVPAVGRQLAGDRSFGYRFSPVQGAGDSLVRVAGDVRRLWKGQPTKQATRDTLEAAGYLTGKVPGQGAASAQFFVDVISGAAHPKNMGDWWEGIRTGRLKAQQSPAG